MIGLSCSNSAEINFLAQYQLASHGLQWLGFIYYVVSRRALTPFALDILCFLFSASLKFQTRGLGLPKLMSAAKRDFWQSSWKTVCNTPIILLFPLLLFMELSSKILLGPYTPVSKPAKIPVTCLPLHHHVADVCSRSENCSILNLAELLHRTSISSPD